MYPVLFRGLGGLWGLRLYRRRLRVSSSSVAAQRAAILDAVPSVASMWGDHLHPGLRQFPVEAARIVRIVPMRRSNRIADGDRRSPAQRNGLQPDRSCGAWCVTA